MVVRFRPEPYVPVRADLPGRTPPGEVATVDDPAGAVRLRAMTLGDAWAAHATAWIAWAREPGHDAFWDGTWPELAAILPDPTGPVVEVGAGEGRVMRQLAAAGYRVAAGIERVRELVVAGEADPGTGPMVLADAAHLPIASDSVPLVVSCMALHDIDELDGAVDEIVRVLCPGGHLCVAIVHPFHSAHDRWTRSEIDPSVAERYLDERHTTQHVERNGIGMTFVSAHRPLGRYLTALTDAGMAVDRFREHGHSLIPWLCTFRAVKLGPSALPPPRRMPGSGCSSSTSHT